jgi:hypothetical protein
MEIIVTDHGTTTFVVYYILQVILTDASRKSRFSVEVE